MLGGGEYHVADLTVFSNDGGTRNQKCHFSMAQIWEILAKSMECSMKASKKTVAISC